MVIPHIFPPLTFYSLPVLTRAVLGKLPPLSRECSHVSGTEFESIITQAQNPADAVLDVLSVPPVQHLLLQQRRQSLTLAEEDGGRWARKLPKPKPKPGLGRTLMYLTRREASNNSWLSINTTSIGLMGTGVFLGYVLP